MSTNDIKGTGPAALAERAVAMARVAPDDPYAGLAEAERLSKKFPDLDLVDPEIPATAHLEKLAREAEAAGLAVKGVTKSGGASARPVSAAWCWSRVHGFSGAYLGSRHSLSMMAIAGEGTGMERDYEFSSKTHAADLDSPQHVGTVAGERTVKRVNPRKVSTRKVPVIFDPRVAGSLIGHLASAANGASVARKTSFLREKLGEKIFGSGIRIIDDPLVARGQRSHPFDGEGVSGQRLAIVEDGVLKTWFLDPATGRELGMPTTGHASRGVSSPPSPAPSNLHLEAGSITPEQLIKDTGDGLYVTDLIGSGVNLVTGDYSRGISGFWIENGVFSYPVSEMTIAGHLFGIFRTLTPANDLVFRYGTNSPTVRIEGLTIAGQ